MREMGRGGACREGWRRGGVRCGGAAEEAEVEGGWKVRRSWMPRIFYFFMGPTLDVYFYHKNCEVRNNY